MGMNIRKIIKEEMGDFEWVKDVNFLSKEYLLGKGIEFDPPIDSNEIDYFKFVIKTLRDIGFRVGFNVSEYIYEMTEEYEEVAGLYIRPTDGRVIITGSIMEETYQEHINDYAETQVDVVMGREIFHMSMNESMDFDWIDNIKIGLKVGEKYVITSENGLFKYTMIYCGRGTTTHPDTKEKIDGHRFKDPNREERDKKCNSWWSDSNLIAHMKRGHIVPYDEYINENMDWAKEINPTPYNGVKFISNTQRENIVYTITDNGGPHVVISWNNGDAYGTFGRGEVGEHFRKGNWSIIDDDREDEISLREDFEWTKDISARLDLNKKMSWKEIVGFLEERFEGTRFWVDVNTYDDDEYPIVTIEDDTGTYDEWYAEHLTSLSVVVDVIKINCDDHGSEQIRLEYCELYDVLMGYV